MQPVALVELQVSVDDAPDAMLLGVAVSVTVGTGVVDPAVTVTGTVISGLLPPAPVHASENEVVAVSAPVDSLPLLAKAPVQPPEAAQAVALVEVHVSIDEPPDATDVGLATSVAAGTGAVVPPPDTVTDTLSGALAPSAPEHTSEYVVVAVKAVVVWLPLAANVPVQPPDAVHDVALVELHVSTVVSPLETEVAAAVTDAVGAGLTGALESPPHAASSKPAPRGMIEARVVERMIFKVRTLSKQLGHAEAHVGSSGPNLSGSPSYLRNVAWLDKE